MFPMVPLQFQFVAEGEVSLLLLLVPSLFHFVVEVVGAEAVAELGKHCLVNVEESMPFEKPNPTTTTMSLAQSSLSKIRSAAAICFSTATKTNKDMWAMKWKRMMIMKMTGWVGGENDRKMGVVGGGGAEEYDEERGE